jgi:hypothetical protein
VPSALDVEKKLLEAMDLEADRLLTASKAGSLEKGDRINLTFYLRAVSEAAKNEVARIEKLNPEALSDTMLKNLIDQEQQPKPKKGRHA